VQKDGILNTQVSYSSEMDFEKVIYGSGDAEICLKTPKASRGSAVPSKSAPNGSAGPLKTETSKDDSSSSRCSPTKVRVDRVLVDVKGFSHPRCSTPSSRPQVPPKPVASDRLKKAEQNLVLSNQFSALSDDEMDSSPISPD